MADHIAPALPSGNGGDFSRSNLIAAIKALKDQHPGLGLREAKAMIDGSMSLADALKTVRSEADAPPLIRPSAAARAALERRCMRLLIEVAQVVARKPAGSGKRQRGRIAQAAECLAELREVTARLRQVRPGKGGAAVDQQISGGPKFSPRGNKEKF